MKAYLVWSSVEQPKDIQQVLDDIGAEGSRVIRLVTSTPDIQGEVGFNDLYIVYTALSGIQISHFHFCKAYREITTQMRINPCIERQDEKESI